MLAAQIGGDGLTHDGIEKRPGQIVVVEPRPVVSERGGVKRDVARLQVEKPAKEQIGVDAFAELAFAADGIQRHDEEGFEEPLRRHAGTTDGAVGLGELRRHPGQDAIDATLDVPQRMVGPDAVLDVEEMKQRELIVGLATHDCSPETRSGEISARTITIQPDFSAAC